MASSRALTQQEHPSQHAAVEFMVSVLSQTSFVRADTRPLQGRLYFGPFYNYTRATRAHAHALDTGAKVCPDQQTVVCECIPLV